MMQDVSNRLLRDFATCLSTRLAEPGAVAEVAAGDAAPSSSTPPPRAQAPQPLKGGSLFFSVLWQRIKQLFKRR
jgi:hypothetical protein